MADNKVQLDEFKASGEDSAVMEPITKGSNKRKLDKNDKQDPASQTAVPGAGDKEDMIDNKSKSKQASRPADKTSKLKEMVSALVKLSEDELAEMHASLVSEKDEEASVAEIVREDFDVLFNEEQFSEEFKAKAFTIFEGAVLAKVIEETYEIEEKFNADFEEAVKDIAEELGDKTDKYLSYVVENWYEENKVEVDKSIKTDVAESFMEGLKVLLDEHYIDVPEDKENVLESLVQANKELEEKYNESIKANMELQESITENEIATVLSEVSEGLTLSQSEKLAEISEGVSFDDLENLKEKLEVLKESAFNVKKENNSAEQELNESFTGNENSETDKPVVDERMQAYVKAAKKF